LLKAFSLQEDDSFVPLQKIENDLRMQYPGIYPEKKGTKGERRYISRACNQPIREQLFEYDYSEWPNIKLRINPSYRDYVKEILSDI